MGDQVLILSGNDRLDARGIITIGDILVGEQVGGRDGHGTQLVQRQDGLPELDVALEDQHHHVSLADAQRLKKGCGPVGEFFQCSKSEILVCSLVVGPAESPFIGMGAGPLIRHIIGEVELLRDLYLIVLREIPVGFEGRLFYKFLNHDNLLSVLYLIQG